MLNTRNNSSLISSISLSIIDILNILNPPIYILITPQNKPLLLILVSYPPLSNTILVSIDIILD